MLGTDAIPDVTEHREEKNYGCFVSAAVFRRLSRRVTSPGVYARVHEITKHQSPFQRAYAQALAVVLKRC